MFDLRALFRRRPQRTEDETVAAAATAVQAGRAREGLELAGAGIADFPSSARLHFLHGVAFYQLGRKDEARAAFLRATGLEGCPAEAHSNLGALAAQAGALDEACAHFERACEADPGSFAAHFNLGRALMETGREAEGDAVLRRAGELQPNGAADALRALAVPIVIDSTAHAQALRSRIDHWLEEESPHVAIDNPTGEMEPAWFALAYHGIDDTARYRRIAQFLLHASPQLAYEAPHCRAGTAGGRLKVGFISKYLHDHSIGRTSRGVIPRLSRERFEVYALFVAPVVDDGVAREIRDGADIAVVVPNSLQQAREVIAALELDILFYQDLGMDPFTYFLAFSRLAPVQAVGWGHPVTTGLPTMDAFISTEDFEPPGGEAHYSERLIRMRGAPTPSFYFRPDAELASLSRADAGFEPGANVYFCPQTFYKLHPDLDGILAGILRADPKGIVYLLHHKHASVQTRLLGRMHRAFPETEGRIRFLSRVPGLTHWYSRLRHADVLLDSLHFCGGNTSLEGFAFGKPIVTLPGAFMRGRHTLAMYRAMGIDDGIAQSAEDYVDRAVRLARDPKAREDLSRRIAERSEVLYENEAVVAAMEAALTEAAQARRR
jgi:predicted O-linked N-acetylglucosamine transferase (SPINDLY family)